jgi:hypothetical protein
MSSIRKQSSAFICVVALALALGCVTTSQTSESSSPNLALAPGMQIGLVTTTVGGLALQTSVNSNEPGGGMLVTVQTVQPGESVTVSWRQAIERELPPVDPKPVVGIGTPEPTPATEIVIEEGTITASGLDSAHAALLPLYWPLSETNTTETSLMWLSQEAFEELKRTQQTRWSADVLTKFTHLPVWAIEQLSEETAERELYLAAEPDFVDLDMTINEQQVKFQAIQAFDDFGNEYIILDDAENPLIVKFRFNAVSTGAIGIDTGIWTLIKAIFSGYQVVEIRQ